MDAEKLFSYLERICTALETITDYIHSSEKTSASEMEPSHIEEVDIDREYEDTIPVQPISDATLLKIFLHEKSIQVKKVGGSRPYDKIFDNISDFIGERYDSVKPLLDRIKSNMAKESSFTLSIKEETQNARSSICQLGNSLYSYAMLKSYIYKKSPHFMIIAKPSSKPEFQNLYSGGWMERYIKNCLIKIMEKIQLSYGLSYKLYHNIQIILPNDDDFELDLLLFVNGLVYWFECKSNLFQDHIDKYSEFSKTYDFDRERSFLVLTSNHSEIQDLSCLYHIIPVDMNDFAEKIEKKILNDLADLEPEETYQELSEEKDE